MKTKLVCPNCKEPLEVTPIMRRAVYSEMGKTTAKRYTKKQRQEWGRIGAEKKRLLSNKN